MPICGFIYHDEVNHCKPVKYSWSGGEEKVSLGDAFKLNAELYLTALWNKLFDMQIIEKFNVRFDENLSMGEDLRFSVEYFEKSDTEFVYAFLRICIIIQNYQKIRLCQILQEVMLKMR